jgi:hypothetical protein
MSNSLRFRCRQEFLGLECTDEAECCQAVDLEAATRPTLTDYRPKSFGYEVYDVYRGVELGHKGVRADKTARAEVRTVADWN